MKIKYCIYILTSLLLITSAIGNLRAQVTTYPYRCDFEHGLDGWKNPDGQLTNWQIGRGDAARREREDRDFITGPTSAYEGNAYAYVNMYEGRSGTAVMTKIFDFTSLATPMLSMYVHNLWTNTEGAYLRVYAKKVESQSWDLNAVNTIMESNGDQWHKFNACLYGYKGLVEIKLEIVARGGLSPNIAIDELTIQDFAIEAEVTDVSCYGYEDGKITLKPSCAGPDYEYSIDDGAHYTKLSEPSMTFENLFAGSYNAKIKDITSGIGCIAALPTILVKEPSEIEVSPQLRHEIRCFGDQDGEIVVITNQDGYDDNYFEFSIDDGISFQSNSTFSDLSGGEYIIKVKNGAGCLSDSYVQLVGADIELTIDDVKVQQVTGCNGDDTGEILIEAMYGNNNSPIAYSIDGGQSATTLSNKFIQRPAGEYDIMVIDRNGCQIKWPEKIVITEPKRLEIDQLTVTDIDGCYGDQNGSIDIKLKGGTGQYFSTITPDLIYNPVLHYEKLAAGTYYLRAKDEKNCELMQDGKNYLPIVISQPDPLAITNIAASDVSTCNGEATGSIEISAQGGTGELTYFLHYDGTTEDGKHTLESKEALFPALKAGKYVPYIIDSKNCQAIYEYNTVEIWEPEVFELESVSAFDKEIECNGDKKGSIFALAIGGTLPYHYTIDDYAHDSIKNTVATCTFAQLGAGEYTVKAKDANGCKAIDTTVTLTEPEALVIKEMKVTPLTCYNNYTGMIELEVEGGTPDTSSILPYIYEWSIHGDNNYRPSTSSAITRLAADIYDVAVTDKYHCTTYAKNVEVKQPEKLTITAITPHDVTLCYGDHNGALIINAIGGTKPYQYSIDYGTSFQTEPKFSDLPAGNDYHIVVRDSNLCVVDGGSTLINQPAPLEITNINFKPVRGCHGSKTGEITFVGSGGSGKLQYSITNYPPQESGDFYELSGGQYALRVEDEHGCYADHSGVEITDPPVLELVSTETTDNPCHGDNQGEAVLTVRGGVPVQTEFPYKFYLDPENEDLIGKSIDPFCYDGVFTRLYAKHYDVVIRDAYNCQIKTSFDISEPALFAFTSIDTTHVTTCNGDATGKLKANITGGIKPVVFTCTSAKGYNQTNNSGSFSNMIATQYELTAEDAHGCLLQEYLYIDQPTPVNITRTSYIDIQCPDGNNGEIRVEGDGGIGDLTVSIDGGKTFPYPPGNITGLKGGDYHIIIRDSHNCPSKNTKTIRLTNPEKLQVVAQGRDVACHQGNTGSISAQAFGGTKPYAYSIDQRTWHDNKTSFTDLTDTTYTVYVKDLHGCIMHSNPVVINRPPNKAGFSLDTYAGCTPLTFTITQDSAGLANYSISNGDAIYDRKGPTTHTIENRSYNVQKYEIVAKFLPDNGVGCLDTAVQYVTVWPKPRVDFRLVDTAVTWPNNIAYITNRSKEITSSYWDFGDGTTSEEFDIRSHTYETCGYYNIVLIESDGRCIDTLEQAFKIEGREIIPSFNTSENNGCEPLNLAFTNASENADSLVWDFGDGTKLVSGTQRVWHTYTAPGDYTATLTLYGDCGASTTTTKKITVFPKPTAVFSQNLDTIYKDQILRVDCESALTDKYIWDFGDGTIIQGRATEDHAYKFNGTFDISLVVVTGNSCSDTARVKNAVVVATSPVVVFPNAFSPNGDGVNDRFLPIHGYLTTYEIIIMNRSGQVVYRSKNIDEGWDGTRNGSPCLPGMYVYKVKTTLRDATIHYQYGHVMLLH